MATSSTSKKRKSDALLSSNTQSHKKSNSGSHRKKSSISISSSNNNSILSSQLALPTATKPTPPGTNSAGTPRGFTSSPLSATPTATGPATGNDQDNSEEEPDDIDVEDNEDTGDYKLEDDDQFLDDDEGGTGAGGISSKLEGLEKRTTNFGREKLLNMSLQAIGAGTLDTIEFLDDSMLKPSSASSETKSQPSSAGGGRKGLDPREQVRYDALMRIFDPSQSARYEAFRRANVSKSAVKKLANSVLGQSIPAPVSVALGGLSKVFIGELIENARKVQHEWNRKYYYELRLKMEKEEFEAAKKKKSTTTTTNTNEKTGISNTTTNNNINKQATVSTSTGTLADENNDTTTFKSKYIKPSSTDLFGEDNDEHMFSGDDSDFENWSMKKNPNPNNLTYPLFDDELAAKEIELLDKQPLRPDHLREAWRIYKRESGTVPAAHWRQEGGEGNGRMFR